MFKKKMAQGISITTIIVAAIALVVLVVLVAIFVGKIKIWGYETANCENQGGECMPSEVCSTDDYQKVRRTDCSQRFKDNEPGVLGPECCLRLTVG